MKTDHGTKKESCICAEQRPQIELLSGSAEGLAIEYGFADSPFGSCLVAATSKGICALSFTKSEDFGGLNAKSGSIKRPDSGKECDKECGGQDSTNVAQNVVADFLREWPGAVPNRNDALATHVISTIFGPTAQNEIDGLGTPKENITKYSASTAPAPVAEAVEKATGNGNPCLKLHLRGTPFQLKIWNTLLEIPLGSTASYAQIASLAGCPTAVRAVASAIARNPVAYIIPCHRVIRSSGATGQYRWAPGRKNAMLLWEKSRVKNVLI